MRVSEGGDEGGVSTRAIGVRYEQRAFERMMIGKEIEDWWSSGARECDAEVAAGMMVTRNSRSRALLERGLTAWNTSEMSVKRYASTTISKVVTPRA